MFKILGRNLKKSLSLFVVFFTISIVFSVFSSYIETQRISSTINNQIFTNKFITFQIGNTTITNNDFVEALQAEKGAIISEPINKNTSSGNAIYFNENCKNVPPIYQGKFFSVNDFSKDIPVAIVGKDLLKSLELKGNEKYFIFEDKPYKVVGLMGYKNKESLYDNRFIINLNSAISNEDIFKKDLNVTMWKFDNIDKSPQDSINNIYKKLKVKDKNFRISINNSSGDYNPLMDAIGIYKSAIFILIIFVLVLFLNVVNISSFWVLDMKKEIGVRKALGGTNKSIIFKILCKYQIIAVSAALLALLVHLILIKSSIALNYLNELYNTQSHVDIINVFILFIFTMLIGLLVSFIPIRQIIKMEPNDIIRGR